MVQPKRVKQAKCGTTESTTEKVKRESALDVFRFIQRRPVKKEPKGVPKKRNRKKVVHLRGIQFFSTLGE